MSAALSALFRSWWRLFRVGNSPTTPASPAPAPVVPDRTEEEVPVVLAVAPQPAPVEVADSALRTQTLEVLQKLQQIPALQSLAQGFLRAATRIDGSVEEVVADGCAWSAVTDDRATWANSTIPSASGSRVGRGLGGLLRWLGNRRYTLPRLRKRVNVAGVECRPVVTPNT